MKCDTVTWPSAAVERMKYEKIEARMPGARSFGSKRKLAPLVGDSLEIECDKAIDRLCYCLDRALPGYGPFGVERARLLSDDHTAPAVLAKLVEHATSMEDRGRTFSHRNIDDDTLAKLVPHFSLGDMLRHEKTGNRTLAALAHAYPDVAALQAVISHEETDSFVLHAVGRQLPQLTNAPQFSELLDGILRHTHIDDRALATIVPYHKNGRKLADELTAESLTINALKTRYPGENFSRIEQALRDRQALQLKMIAENDTVNQPKRRRITA